MALSRPRSIRGLIMLAGGIFAGLTICLGIATYLAVNASIDAQLDVRLERASRHILAEANPANASGVSIVVRQREARRSMANFGYIVIDGQGRRVAGTLNAAVPKEGYWDCLPYKRMDGQKASAQSLNSRIPGGGSLIVAIDRSSEDHIDDILLVLFGCAFGLVLILGFGGAALLDRAVNRRLDGIGSAAAAIMAGDLSRRMPTADGKGEFDQLSAVINRMLDRIEILLDNLRQISTDIAHDLRSPLNRLRGELEEAERGLEGLSQQVHVQNALRETGDVLDLLGGLLGISEIEGFTVRSRFAPLDLSDLVDKLVDGYRPAMEANGLTIGTTTEPTAFISGDASLLRRCLANLLDNAIVHTPPGTNVAIEVVSRSGSVTLTISDDGPGIAADEHEAIFRRLVRLDPSRSRPGHGLGLSMVAAIAKAHFGAARVLPSAAGLTIQLDLPAAP